MRSKTKIWRQGKWGPKNSPLPPYFTWVVEPNQVWLSWLSQLIKKRLKKNCFVLFLKKRDEIKNEWKKKIFLKIFKERRHQFQEKVNFEGRKDKFSKIIKSKGYHFSKKISNFKLRITNFKLQISNFKEEKIKSFSNDYKDQSRFSF